MTNKFIKPLALFSITASVFAIYACTKSTASSAVEEFANKNQKLHGKKIDFQNYSVTPSLIKKFPGFDGVDVYSLISSDDEFQNFRFGGSADGAGFLKAEDGEGYIMLVNNEDNFAVSKLYLDKNLKPIKGEYALNSDGGQWRLCSGSLAIPQEHGFGPLYLTCGESGAESMTHGLNPYAPSTPSAPKALAGLGRWSAENAVPLSKHAYPGKTIVITGEDASDASGGQLLLYKSILGDLENGEQFMLKRVDGNQRETDMVANQEYEVEFAKIENHKALSGAAMQAKVTELKGIKFGRVEDIDYRKGSHTNSREIYFNVTGQEANGFNADRSRTVFGRVYKLVLDPANPLKGKLTCILDGDNNNGIAKDFQNPDNICVTENYVYIQEDSNTYGTEEHDAYIYQYNIATGEMKVVFELDHRRTAPDATKYNVGGPSAKGSWEYGALIDISDVVHVPNTFVLAIQPHTWRSARFAGVDGGSKRLAENQGSQLVVITGLPR